MSMTDELFHIRDARPDDKATVDAYSSAEGMDVFPSIDNIRVAVNDDDQVVGFLRLAFSDAGVAFVNPVVVYETWRGYGVGRALVEEALARHGELRLVSRGNSLGFYEALGFKRIPWDMIEMDLVDDCEHCGMRDECGPVPLARTRE